jgi:hypothetical protein
MLCTVSQVVHLSCLQVETRETEAQFVFYSTNSRLWCGVALLAWNKDSLSLIHSKLLFGFGMSCIHLNESYDDYLII